MKFTFYCNTKGKKSKQVISVKNNEDLRQIATIAKCEITKRNILDQLDFSLEKLTCEIKGEKYNMKELWNYISDKLGGSIKKKGNKKKKKGNNKKESKVNKSKKKQKKSKKTKVSINFQNKRDNTPIITSSANGLIKITRK